MVSLECEGRRLKELNRFGYRMHQRADRNMVCVHSSTLSNRQAPTTPRGPLSLLILIQNFGLTNLKAANCLLLIWGYCLAIVRFQLHDLNFKNIIFVTNFRFRLIKMAHLSSTIVAIICAMLNGHSNERNQTDHFAKSSEKLFSSSKQIAWLRISLGWMFRRASIPRQGNVSKIENPGHWRANKLPRN